ncbi:PTS cellobiose transporter subunit IIC [Lactobacillus sp. ESL0791]|uniref:PTS cellobiose transporter subunit IIC n=1 Tax=Lactobacillus sp. ESL0791 TaxID=2983234 RepID=UPI0023F88AA3|nr:PTS cellobiose transporter subunit IIC [Lactobacillus sp. ESL0791]MDF7638324.1 PTS cellobiose transporter subunit IIC [Lactobacillus sp. ESL0791]
MSKAEGKPMKDRIAEIAGRFAATRFVRAIMDAGYSVITFSIVGAIFLILTVLPSAFPIPGFAAWYAGTIGRFTNLFQAVYNATMGILALVFSGTFAYSYTRIYRTEEHLDLIPVNGLMMFLMAFFITVPELVWKNGSIQFVTLFTKDKLLAGGYQSAAIGGIYRIGAVGIFTGLVIAWLTVQIYRYTVKHNWRIKMPESVPSGVANSFSALIPGFLIAAIVAAINLILVMMGTDLFKVLFIPFSFISNITDTWWGFLIIIFLIHFLWWFGIHGATIISSFYTPIVMANMQANANVQIRAHHFFAGEIMNAFITIGGSGATLGLAIWLLLRARSVQLKEIGKVEIVPAIFNINEPILFGLPIVYNIDLLVPFIGAPLASGIVTFLGISSGLVPIIKVQQPWPTPVGLNGFIATTSWQGAVLSVVCAVVAFIVWYPFIKHYDNVLLKKEQAAEAEIKAE